jgi:MFS family permease
LDEQKYTQDALFWHLVWAFYIPSTLIASAYGILALVLPVFAENLTPVYILIGMILAAESLGSVVGDIPTSWFMRRFGLKETMIIGLWMALLPIALLFLTQNVWLIIILLFVSGFGHALYNITRHAYITIIVQKGLRGRAIGAAGGVYRIGNFLGPVLGGVIAGTLGLKYAFLAFGLVALMTLFFVWRFMRATVSDDLSHKSESQRALLAEVFQGHWRILLNAGAGQILAQLTRKGWVVLIPLYAIKVLELDVQTIGYIMSIGAGLDMLFFLLSGVIMDRFGRKWAIIPSFVLQAIGTAMILFTGDAIQLATVAGFIGLANALSSGAMMTLGSDLAPAHLRGEFLGIWRLIGDGGFVAAPIIIGAIAQAFVLEMSIMSIAGAGFAAAFLFTVFVPETFKAKEVVAAAD